MYILQVVCDTTGNGIEAKAFPFETLGAAIAKAIEVRNNFADNYEVPMEENDDWDEGYLFRPIEGLCELFVVAENLDTDRLYLSITETVKGD